MSKPQPTSAGDPSDETSAHETRPSSAKDRSSYANPVAQKSAPSVGRGGTPWRWVVVAVLAAAALIVGTVFATQAMTKQTTNTPPASTTPTASTGSAPPSASTSTSGDPSAQASSSEAAIKLMQSLPRRKAGDPTALGKVDAPVILLVWTDYRCPYCALWAQGTFEKLLPYVESGSLRIEARDLILFGEESRQAAIASRAAGLQGRYWPFHAATFAAASTTGHNTVTKDDLLEYAKQAKVPDLKKFEKDLSDPDLAAAVDADTKQAQQIGITGTPFFVINTTPISGNYPLEAFTQTIEGYGGHV